MAQQSNTTSSATAIPNLHSARRQTLTPPRNPPPKRPSARSTPRQFHHQSSPSIRVKPRCCRSAFPLVAQQHCFVPPEIRSPVHDHMRRFEEENPFHIRDHIRILQPCPRLHNRPGILLKLKRKLCSDSQQP